MRSEPAPYPACPRQNNTSGLAGEPDPFVFNAVVIDPEGTNGPLTVPDRSRVVAVQPGLSIVFKSVGDAAACTLTQQASDWGGLLTVDATQCNREVRLLCDCTVIADSLMAVPADAVLSLTIVIDLQAQHQGEEIQWVALLSAPAGGPYADLKKVAKRVPLIPNHRTTAAWRVELPGGWQANERLYLAVQMAPHARPVSFGRMTVAIESLLTGRGGLTVTKEGVVGWLPTGDEAAARILVGRDGATLAHLSLERGLSEASSSQTDAVSFGLSGHQLAKAIQAAGGELPGRYDVALVVSSVIAAQSQINLVVPAQSNQGSMTDGQLALTRGAGSEPVGPLSLAHAEIATLVRELVVATGSGLVRDTLEVLYKGKERGKLWRLWDALGLESGRFDLDAYLAFYFAKAMLQQNMATLAYDALAALVHRPEVLNCLTPPEQRRARLLLARAAARTGCTLRALHELNRLKCECPADWEVHFDLGLLHNPADPTLSARHFRLADALEPQMPVAARAVRLETFLDEGRADEALLSCTLALQHHGTQTELLVSLANVYLALGDRDAWAAALNQFFTLSGVASGFFDSERTDKGHLLEGLSYATGYPHARPASGLVTVIMTTYNSEATVAAAVRSVLAQSYPHLRLVVVDDASTDGTHAIVSALAAEDSRVILLDTDTNRGTYWAKNRGLSQFASDYYTFHDSDDWMHPERIAVHVEHMQKNAECRASLSQWIRVSESGRVMLRRRFGAGAAAYAGANPASLFIPQEVVNRVGFFDTVRAGADSEYTYRIARVFGRAAVTELPALLGVGLHHDASLTQSGSAAYDSNRYSEVRQRYWESWMTWHHDAVPQDLYMAFPESARKFRAPAELLRSSPDGHRA